MKVSPKCRAVLEKFDQMPSPEQCLRKELPEILSAPAVPEKDGTRPAKLAWTVNTAKAKWGEIEEALRAINGNPLDYNGVPYETQDRNTGGIGWYARFSVTMRAHADAATRNSMDSVNWQVEKRMNRIAAIAQEMKGCIMYKYFFKDGWYHVLHVWEDDQAFDRYRASNAAREWTDMRLQFADWHAYPSLRGRVLWNKSAVNNLRPIHKAVANVFQFEPKPEVKAIFEWIQKTSQASAQQDGHDYFIMKNDELPVETFRPQPPNLYTVFVIFPNFESSKSFLATNKRPLRSLRFFECLGETLLAHRQMVDGPFLDLFIPRSYKEVVTKVQEMGIDEFLFSGWST